VTDRKSQTKPEIEKQKKNSTVYHFLLSMCLQSGLDKLKHTLFPLRFTLLVRQGEASRSRVGGLLMQDTFYLLKEFNLNKLIPST